MQVSNITGNINFIIHKCVVIFEGVFRFFNLDSRSYKTADGPHLHFRITECDIFMPKNIFSKNLNELKIQELCHT